MTVMNLFGHNHRINNLTFLGFKKYYIVASVHILENVVGIM